MVGVLELVHHQVPRPPPQPLPHVLFLAQQLHGMGDHVVEVDPRGLLQQPLVPAVDLGHLALEVVVRLVRVAVRADQLVLGGADGGQHGARPVRLLRQPFQGQRLLDDLALVVAVHNVELRRQPHPGAVAAQGEQGPAVEGADEGGQRVEPQQVLHPLPHLGCRLVGEGDGGDGVGVHPPGLDQPGGPVGDDPGLARARPGEDQLRPLPVGDRLQLGGVELLFEVEGAAGRGRGLGHGAMVHLR